MGLLAAAVVVLLTSSVLSLAASSPVVASRELEELETEVASRLSPKDDRLGLAVRSYIYDDSLNGQWRDWSWGAIADWHDDTQSRGERVTCSASCSLQIDKFGAVILALQDASNEGEGMLVPANMSMQMWLLLTTEPDPQNPAEASALDNEFGAELHVYDANVFDFAEGKSRPVGVKLADLSVFDARDTNASGGSWRHLFAPMSKFGLQEGARFNRIAITAFDHAIVRFNMDDIRFLVPQNTLPAFRTKHETILSQVMSHPIPKYSYNVGESTCKYMVSPRQKDPERQNLPFCKVDGDQLRGVWEKNCLANSITRPALYAYNRSLPAATGQYDFRFCYKMGGLELLRTGEALSYAWTPESCTMTGIDPQAFDNWLGGRSILFVGDSLSAQHYFSLKFLLGDHVVEQVDDMSETFPEDQNYDKLTRIEDSCTETVIGNEGGWFGWFKLRGGGTVYRVMQHLELFDHLKDLSTAWWLDTLRKSDIVVMNIGHHYHRIDGRFRNYGKLAQMAAKQFSVHAKPDSQFIFRTSNLGHWNCSNNLKPLDRIEEAWEQLGGDADKYFWRKPILFEGAWRDAFDQAGMQSRFRYLNISFVDMRADGHVAASMFYSESKAKQEWGYVLSDTGLDCLHYCFPGPVDYWSVALYNMLLHNKEFA